MKKIFNIKCLIPIFAVGLMLNLSSCLKPNDTYVDFSKAGTTVELPLAALNRETNVRTTRRSYTVSPVPGELPVVVNIASPKPLDRDLTVTLAVDGNDVAALNASTTPAGTFVLIPANGYSIQSLQVVIPAGQRTATANFRINSTNLTVGATNIILPVRIADAGGEKISNYNTVYYNVRVNP